MCISRSSNLKVLIRVFRQPEMLFVNQMCLAIEYGVRPALKIIFRPKMNILCRPSNTNEIPERAELYEASWPVNQTCRAKHVWMKSAVYWWKWIQNHARLQSSNTFERSRHSADKRANCTLPNDERPNEILETPFYFAIRSKQTLWFIISIKLISEQFYTQDLFCHLKTPHNAIKLLSSPSMGLFSWIVVLFSWHIRYQPSLATFSIVLANIQYFISVVMRTVFWE